MVHLAARLDDIGLDTSHNKVEGEVTEENLSQVLWECCQKIDKMINTFPAGAIDLDDALDMMLRERQSMKSPTKVSQPSSFGTALYDEL